MPGRASAFIALSLGTLTLGALTLGARATARAEPLTPALALTQAVGRDPGLRAALIDIRSAEASVLVEDRARKPVLSATVQGNHTERFRSTTQGVSRNASDGVSASVRVDATTDLGTTVGLGVSLDTSWTTQNVDVGTIETVTLGPDRAALVGIDARQPLLRGGGALPVLAALRQARRARGDAAVLQERVASQLAHDVLVAYWALWYAQSALEVERAAYLVTEKNQADTRVRAEVLKTAPTLDVLRFSTELGAARGRVAAAEATLLDRQLALGRLLGVSPADPGPTTAPPEPEAPGPTPALAALFVAADESSYDLRLARSALAQAKDAARTAEDGTLARLDLVAAVSAGVLWTDTTDGLFPGGRPAIIASLGLELELPLGSSSAGARAWGAHARVEASDVELARQSELLRSDVARLRASLEAARETLRIVVDTAVVARELADKEASRLALGTTVLLDLITARQSAREAELARLRALTDLATLAVDLEHLVGTLLPRLASNLPAGLTGTSPP